MANCSRCSAPLPANSQYCSYCGVRNDIDLAGKHPFRVLDADSERTCPVCRQRLQTITLSIEASLRIERCAGCFGLFFDPGEIERLLDSSASALTVNLDWLDNINQERYPADDEVKYLPCPVCQVLMNRVVYGYRSGVVIDQCKSHGIWLDGGQISHLLEWKKAGGQLLNQQKLAAKQKPIRRPSAAEVDRQNVRYPSTSADTELLASVAEFIFKVFE